MLLPGEELFYIISAPVFCLLHSRHPFQFFQPLQIANVALGFLFSIQSFLPSSLCRAFPYVICFAWLDVPIHSRGRERAAEAEGPSLAGRL